MKQVLRHVLKKQNSSTRLHVAVYFCRDGEQTGQQTQLEETMFVLGLGVRGSTRVSTSRVLT
jgi:hypothetical protein